jgi:hypothetical protein
MKLMQAKKQSNAGTKRLADGKKRPLPDCYQKSGAKENVLSALYSKEELIARKSFRLRLHCDKRWRSLFH